MKKSNPAEKYLCGPHLRRTGRRVPSFMILAGEGLCEPCFRGKAILDAIEESGVYRGRLPGYNSTGCGGLTPPKKRHFVSDRRVATADKH